MLANAKAVAAGAAEVQTSITGQPWTQQPFPYQAKCLGWLREAFAGLDAGARDRVAALLEPAGCLAMLEGEPD